MRNVISSGELEYVLLQSQLALGGTHIAAGGVYGECLGNVRYRMVAIVVYGRYDG